MNFFEIEILKSISDFMSCGALDFIFKFVSWTGNKGAIWIVSSLILCAFPKTRKAGICSMISLILCLIIGNGILKPLFSRTRPYDFDTTIRTIIPHLKDGSFPSGHTLAAFAFSYVTCSFFVRLKPYLYGYSALMGFSRIYLCVHYPTDVIAGVVLGIAFGVLACKIYSFFVHKLKTPTT